MHLPIITIGGLQLCDCENALNSDTEQEVNGQMDDTEESPFCASLEAVMRFVNIKSEQISYQILKL